ncbi:1-deoxy-D-xylulose-5-phosphate synthase [Methylotenera mobilis]|uniref:1-deoxy-D-xylulose-5-phosphate synthase n=1 Tax=Methylotenera mobilis (strain JLW8 / ATCC BAA-1282 / DSM 17540) TaxID=583345 RepID=C6WUB5_METML|nr:1-deoxy-D-xylulose-5-phosphate synthase [Methylotenera mobilis]ACT47514.1 deoxyxylulose-5-phosphate synthase [Methylotenera mobilis JLW8]
MTPLLNTINDPEQLRLLERRELVQLAHELRLFLVDSVAKTGGHLASNLGVVELTIALHYVFNTPDDKLVWDVGHQTYPHKILTGRREAMQNLRKPQGIAGFPRRNESGYDTFGTGHSSTSISAALGMAVAAQKAGSERRSVAIIGDGAMTAGMAFEALNNAGNMDANLLVVLNDNDMSISNNVGALNNYLAKLLSSRFYGTVRKSGKKVLSALPPMMEFAKRAEEHVKGMVTPGTLFEEFGFNYIGPIDGHDLDALIDTLHNIKQLNGPQFLHIVTQKGKGFEPAEANPNKFHGVGKFDPFNGNAISAKAAKSYTEVFGDWLVDMAAADHRLIGVTPAMCDGSGLNAFASQFPERYYDVGIAEQHALTFAAGMACDGLKPVVAIYSTFLQRAYDQLIHDIALQNLPVLLAIDRAGLVGADGPTHAGSFDLTFMRCIPNIVIMTPSNENECRQMLSTGFLYNGVAAVRYPRGSGTGATVNNSLLPIEIGKGRIERQGEKVAILAFGSMLAPALEAAEAINATVANMRFVKPIDHALIAQLASTHTAIITIEENCVMGGAGSAVMESLQAMQHSLSHTIKTLSLGLPDQFIEHGVHETMLADCGLDAKGIASAIAKLIT